MLPGTQFYSWYSYSYNSRFIPGITVITGIIYSSFQEPAPGVSQKPNPVIVYQLRVEILSSFVGRGK